jgi:hypothetical protein
VEQLHILVVTFISQRAFVIFELRSSTLNTVHRVAEKRVSEDLRAVTVRNQIGSIMRSILLQSICFIALLLSRSVSFKGQAQKFRYGRITSTPLYQSSLKSTTDVQEKLKLLRVERDQKRNELRASEIAANRAENAYRDLRSQYSHIEGSSFTPGTYDYGFNTQSNDVLLVNKNSGLGGSVPVGIIKLAITNFKREFGEKLEF